MFIDIHVFPAFYEPINEDEAMEELRHETLDIHKNGTAALEHIFNQMRCAGLDKLTLLPQDYNTQQNGITLVSNEEIAKLVELAPDKFIGFASVDPFDPKAAEKLEHAFTQLKLKGLYLHPGRLHFYPNDAVAQPLYDICEKYNKPIIFHSGLSWEPNTLTKYCRPDTFEELAASRPNLRICLGQFGWPWCRETAMLMLKFPNVYTDIGALYFDCAREFLTQMLTVDVPRTWIDRSLRHQVMFGSSNPRFEQIRMAEVIGKLGFRESTLELIKGQNAIEFLGGLD
ncbi:MAG: amidohydrolase [Oscillospiraceae bacterium]|nr:amidohydrolase [Oscillospiraceae bacterium]